MKHCVFCNKLTKITEQGYCHTCYARLRYQGVIKNIVKPEMPKILTPLQLDVFNGTVLGDASLRCNHTTSKAQLSITRVLTDKEYLDWQYKIFEDFSLSGVKTKSTFDGRTSKTYHKCYFSTRYSETLYPLYLRWISNGKKIVPNDLKLTTMLVAIWFYDDGHISKRKNYPHALESNFSTHSFNKEEVFFLKDLLTDRYNEKFSIDTVVSKMGKNKGQLQFMIRAGNITTRTMVKDIAQANVLGMERKSSRWNDPLVHLYDNFCEEGREFISKITELKIIDFILKNYTNEDCILISDLPDQLKISRGLISKNFVRLQQSNALIKCNDYITNYPRGTYYKMDDILLRQYKQDHF